MTPVLVFDIETIPDVEGLRKLWALGTIVNRGAFSPLFDFADKNFFDFSI